MSGELQTRPWNKIDLLANRPSPRGLPSGYTFYARDVQVGYIITITNNVRAWAPFGGGSIASSTFALLPATADPGTIRYVSNGLKVGELPGNGTGVDVYFSNGAWRVFSDDQPVEV